MEIREAITDRYKNEANSCDNLSCGNNLQYAAFKNGEIVLDLGCGRGKDAIAAAISVAPLGKVIGLDLTDEMLAVAKKAAQEQKITNVEFLQGDIEALPFKDSSFHIVLSNCVINHAKDKLKVYQEIYRVLKPEGRLLISDIVALEDLPLEIRNDEQAWANCFAGAEKKDDYFNTIAEAGFEFLDILRFREYKKEGYLIASVTFNAFKTKGVKEHEKNY